MPLSELDPIGEFHGNQFSHGANALQLSELNQHGGLWQWRERGCRREA